MNLNAVARIKLPFALICADGQHTFKNIDKFFTLVMIESYVIAQSADEIIFSIIFGFAVSMLKEGYITLDDLTDEQIDKLIKFGFLDSKTKKLKRR